MTKVSIASRGVSLEMDTDKLSTDIIARLVVHGLTQKVADAAAGAMKVAGFEGKKFAELSEEEQGKVASTGLALMQKVADALVAGEWGVERTGAAAIDPVTREVHILLRPAVKKSVGALAWKTMSQEEIVDMLDATFAKQPDDKKAAIIKAAKQQLAEKAKAKALADSLAIEL